MAEQITTDEVRLMLRDALRKRSDLGLHKTVARYLLEPLSPFDPNSTRRPQRWFVLSGLVSSAALGAVVYFNVWT
jgi:hypothetical protein